MKILLFSRTIRLISTKLWTKRSWMKETQSFTKRTISLSNTRWLVFFFPNQLYDIIIALRKCVYWFEGFSQVRDVAIGPLVKWNIVQEHLTRNFFENLLGYQRCLVQHFTSIIFISYCCNSWSFYQHEEKYLIYTCDKNTIVCIHKFTMVNSV